MKQIVTGAFYDQRQNISLPGHRDDGPVILNTVDESVYGDVNQRNFCA